MMKKLFTIIGLGCVLATASWAQTDATDATVTKSDLPQVESLLSQTAASLTLSKILTITNWALQPYLTYAPDIKASSSKVGGGVLALYNINDYMGAAAGIDYLGRFSLLSANATLKYSVKVNQYIQLPEALDNLTLTPFVLGGIGTPFGGNSSQAATIWDVGAAVQFGHFLGGKFNTGAAYGAWENAGDYSGKRYHIFVGWSKGF